MYVQNSSNTKEAPAAQADTDNPATAHLGSSDGVRSGGGPNSSNDKEIFTYYQKSKMTLAVHECKVIVSLNT